MNKQTFTDTNTGSWLEFEQVPGTQILPLAEPVPQGSIHRLRMAAGTIIPVHFHPCDECVYVLDGTMETGGRECQKELSGVRLPTQRTTHKAITDVEIITIRLGSMGVFETR